MKLTIPCTVSWQRELWAKGDSPLFIAPAGLGDAIVAESPDNIAIRSTLNRFEYPDVNLVIDIDPFPGALEVSTNRGFCQAAVGEEGILLPTFISTTYKGQTVYCVSSLLPFLCDKVSETATTFYLGVLLK